MPTNSSSGSPSFRLRILLIRHGESENNLHHEISLQAFEEHRVPDPSITARGTEQAQCVADYFQKMMTVASANNDITGGDGVDAMYVSPMRRTMQTAVPIVEAIVSSPQTDSTTNVEEGNDNGNHKSTKAPPLVQVWTDIYEVSGVHDRGIGKPGLTSLEMQDQFPVLSRCLPDTVTEQGWYDMSLGRETNAHGQRRCQKVWKNLVAMAQALTQNSCIIMVVHGYFMDYLLQAALGILEVQDSDIHNPLVEKSKIFPTWNASITAVDIHSSNCQRPTILFHNSVAHLPSHLVKTSKLGKC